MFSKTGIIFVYSGPTSLPPEVIALMERGQLRRLPDKVDETWLPSPVRVVKVNLLGPRNSPASVRPAGVNLSFRSRWTPGEESLAYASSNKLRDCHVVPIESGRLAMTDLIQSPTTNHQTPHSVTQLRQGYAGREASWGAQTTTLYRRLGYAFIALSLGGMLAPFSQQLRLEAGYLANKVNKLTIRIKRDQPFPKSVPIIFDPLVTPEGASINPINTEFSVIVPKIGINAAVIPAVNPANPGEYLKALEKGVAHASTSYFPDENGTVYLFSHSTNYDWFVNDLNAVFYLLKNLEPGDLIVVYYKNVRYTYKLREKQVVKPSAVSYLAPQLGSKNLILQTCWPPGSVAERLLIFADLIEEQGEKT